MGGVSGNGLWSRNYVDWWRQMARGEKSQCRRGKVDSITCVTRDIHTVVRHTAQCVCEEL
jgi:hypothetical protein